MPEIVLATLNAKYIHAAFGLRYLKANLGELTHRACITEFDINQRPLEIAECILSKQPAILGLGVYIWNVSQTAQVLSVIRKIRPDIHIILGGPEVSYETDSQDIVRLADYVITGEADLKFQQVCQTLLQGAKPPAKVIPAELPEFSQLQLPYELYDDRDVAHRVIYVEASRGCPFTCEFCLSSLDIPVRQVPLPDLLEHLEQLLDRGVKQFKFVDRTFNLNLNITRALLEFFLERYQPGRFFHFEMVPDRLPAPLREVIARFPPGSLQFEVGIQTFNEEVASLISRRQNYARVEENLRFLRDQTGVHVHADLIAGLPGETLASFAAGFDRLIGLGPQEIQVGMLKRLRGTPIVRHDSEWGMLYDSCPPYEILQTRTIDFATMHELRGFSRYWDLVGNSGNFIDTRALIWSDSDRCSSLEKPESTSPFYCFWRCSRWLRERTRRADGIALVRLMELLFDFLTTERGLDPKLTAKVLWRDYQRGGRRDKPIFLRKWLGDLDAATPPSSRAAGLPKRQARHASLP